MATQMLAAGARSPRHSEKLRVLIADTDRACAELEGALDGEGIEVLQAHSFQEAVAQARRYRPQLYVVGYHFDGGQPYRLISHLLSEDDESRILVIRALRSSESADDEEEIRSSYRSLGAKDYLVLHEELEQGGRDAALRRFADEVRRWLSGA